MCPGVIYEAAWTKLLAKSALFCDRYIKLAKKHGLEISQPALSHDSGLTWLMTARREDVEVHKYER